MDRVAGEKLLQQRPEREQVGSRGHLLAAGLLGAHVGDGSEHRSEAGTEGGLGRVGEAGGSGLGLLGRQRSCRQTGRGVGGRIVLLQGLAHGACDAEVEHLDGAGRRHHGVVGLQIAMHDTARMGGGERLGDSPRHSESGG